jgi:hypothetical protein
MRGMVCVRIDAPWVCGYSCRVALAPGWAVRQGKDMRRAVTTLPGSQERWWTSRAAEARGCGFWYTPGRISRTKARGRIAPAQRRNLPVPNRWALSNWSKQ